MIIKNMCVWVFSSVFKFEFLIGLYFWEVFYFYWFILEGGVDVIFLELLVNCLF